MSPGFEIPVTLEVRAPESTALAAIATVFQEELNQACRDIGVHVSERVKRIVVDEKIWYTGTLLNSITWSLIEETASVVGVAVGTNILYGKYQEYGTVPHFVPFHLAKTLYDQALYDWGWLPVTPKASAALNASPSRAVSKGPAGMSIITGKRQSYLTKHPERLWLRPAPGARPVWGVVVSGNRQPFLYPGWEQSVRFAERRLLTACERASARISGGG